MAALSSISARISLLGPIRLSGVRPQPPATSALRSRARLPLGRRGYRLGIDVIGKVHAKCRVPSVFASGLNPPPSGPDAGKGNASSSSSSGVADGPPLATILAGIVVFLLVCWVIGSIVMWLVGLIVNAPPS